MEVLGFKMIWKILPYSLGILVTIYLNWFPISLYGSSDPILGLFVSYIGSSLIGLPVWGVSWLSYLIVKSFNRNNPNRKSLVLSRKILRFTGIALISSNFSCAFFLLFRMQSSVLEMFYRSNPLEVPKEQWNEAHLLMASLLWCIASVIIITSFSSIIYLISKWKSNISDKIRFSEIDETGEKKLRHLLEILSSTIWKLYFVIIVFSISFTLYALFFNPSIINPLHIILLVLALLGWITSPAMPLLFLGKEYFSKEEVERP